MTDARRRVRLLLVLALVASGCGSSPTPAAPAPSPTPPTTASASPSTAQPVLATPSAAPCSLPATPAAKDWNGRVWYEAFVRSFADSSGDGIGDLRGLTARLDYLNDGNPATTTDLGITGIWLMPIMEAASYHGYDVIDYRRVEQDYGTSADFAAFLAAAHRRGIAVILDLVMNHTSDQNPWFLASRQASSPKAGWYVWSAADPGVPGPNGQVVWHPLDGRFYYGVFGASMPDLNLRSAAVTAELEDIARHWLGLGVDGFRLDAIPYLVEEGR